MWWMLAGAALGALFGGLGAASRKQQQKDAIKQQKKMARESYQLGKNYSDLQYAQQRTQAFYQLGEQNRQLNEGVGHFTDQFNTNLMAQAYGIQDARIQNESGIGMSLAAEGASGTRGNEANEMIRAYARAGLEQQIDLQNRQNANTLAETMTGASNAARAISYELNSWNPGGYRYEAKQAQDNYNLNMMKLGQSNFDWSLGQINKYAPYDYVSGIFGGATSGMNLGYTFYEYDQKWWDWNWGKGF